MGRGYCGVNFGVDSRAVTLEPFGERGYFEDSISFVRITGVARFAISAWAVFAI
jgi:hypothetical protein